VRQIARLSVDTCQVAFWVELTSAYSSISILFGFGLIAAVVSPAFMVSLYFQTTVNLCISPTTFHNIQTALRLAHSVYLSVFPIFIRTNTFFIYLKIFNWFVFVMVIKCVFCAVGAQLLYESIILCFLHVIE
jgi:hypothetical protein